MKTNKWIAGLLLFALLCPLLALPARAEVPGLTVETGVKTAAGKNANVITLAGDGRFCARLILAGDKYSNSEPVEDMLREAEKYGEIVAAFNGTWFNAYDESQTTVGAVYQVDSYFESEFSELVGFYVRSNSRYLWRSEGKGFHYTADGRWAVGYVDNLSVSVCCGPSLISGGSNDIGPDSQDQNAAQRTFVGVTEAGELVVGEAATTYNDAAETLLARGCVSGVCMDGGASSFLYADGKVLQPAGRNLNNIIVIYRTEGAPKPSAWAEDEIRAAEEAGILPVSFGNSFIPLEGGSRRYQTPIPRKEAARLFLDLTDAVCGRGSTMTFIVYDYLQDKEIGFSDTSEGSCLVTQAIGIIRGMGDGTFQPNGSLTRAQAATIVCNVADLFGIDRSGADHGFTDVSGHWCEPYLGWPVREGILNGVGDSRFDPNGILTREQAVVIAYRLMNVLLSHGASAEALEQHFAGQ